ncbi:MAG: SF0329 family protein [Bacillota bacterium]
MAWSKMKQQLGEFLSPSLCGRVEYSAASYRYLPDKAGRCHITVDKKNIFNMSDATAQIRWYQTEQEIKNDPDNDIPATAEEIEAVRKTAKGMIPEERIMVIARNRRISEYAKEIFTAQTALSKSDFYTIANRFISSSIEESLESNDILLNIMALVDRRVGKKRLLSLAEKMKQKHPAVRYFYELRLSTYGETVQA